MLALVEGVKLAFAARSYRMLGFGTFAFGLLFYLMTLPSSYTGGQIGLEAMRYLDAPLVFFSLIMAALIAMLLPMMVFQIRVGQQASKASAAGGVAVGIMTPILCCSPLLPIALGLVATVVPSLVNAVGWRLQGFIATHQYELFSVASALLVLAVWQNARSISKGLTCKPRADRSEAMETTMNRADAGNESR